MHAFFWNFKTFSSYHDKTPPLSIAKCYFSVLADCVEYEKVLTGIIKRNTSDVELRKGKTKISK